MIKYLNGTHKKYLTLSADYSKFVNWYLDKSFVVHPDLNIHAVYIMTMVQETMQSVSRK